LLALARDLGVTRVAARLRRESNGRDALVVEILRNGQVSHEPFLQDAAELEEVVKGLLGPDRAVGAVAVRDLQGLAALPPAAQTPVLVLDRATSRSPTPEHDGPVPRGLADAAAAVLGMGAGVVLAGPHGPHVRTVIRAVCARLGPSGRLVLVEDGLPTPVRGEVIRLREAPADACRLLKHAVVVLNLGIPPTLPSLSGSVLVVVPARSLAAALARLISGSTASPRVLASLCADAAPLLLWVSSGRSGARVEGAYEILPLPDTAGLPTLQLLAGTDPETGAVIPTGAAPVDPALGEAWTHSGWAG